MAERRISRATYEPALITKGFTEGKIRKATYGRRYYTAVHKPSGEVTTFEVDEKEAAREKDILAIFAWVRLL